MLLSPAAQNNQLPGGNWSSWGRPAGNGGKKGGGGGKKETAAPPPPPQAALARQRLLTLALDENETIRLLPTSYAELEQIARDWLRVGPDSQFALRVPVEYVSISTARLVQGTHIYIADDESYQIATMGVQGLRVEIMADAPPPDDAPPPPPVLEMPATFNMELAPGQHVALDTTVSSDELDMARMEDGTTVDGVFWGKLAIIHEGDKHEMEFTGTRLPGDYDIPPEVIFDPRLMSRLTSIQPMTAKCHLSILAPVQQYCDLYLTFSPMWQVTVTWPPGERVPDQQNKLKFFMRASPGGALEHFETQTVATAIYYEAMPDASLVDPYEFVAPRNGFAMPFSEFINHILRVFDQLGASVHTKTNFIHNHMSAFSAHKNIAYRFLSPGKIAAAIDISVSLEQCVFTRLFLIFRGIDDEEIEELWEGSTEKEANTCNWRERVGWTENSKDSTLFRVLETSVLEVR